MGLVLLLALLLYLQSKLFLVHLARTWDIICFIEHLCVSNLVKLLMVLGLSYITLLFIYLLFKVGIIQCIGRSLCKMTWAACQAYWFALEDISCFLWHKLKNVKRVNRRRHFRDVEEGYSSSEDDDRSLESYGSLRAFRRQRSVRERRKDRIRRSLYPVRHRSMGRYKSGDHHHLKLRTSEVMVHFKDSSGARNSRQLQVRNAANRREMRLVKRRRR
ncbi:uncharacterized protein LOC143889324 isoform X2 [Tasmannia lanceolata]|uniref:uncharacterized protein LOC143889324 isoform X2 n=1 Tax=Tasmannia lanceolata TaxID=3420 RepID=UPI0040630171